MSRPDLTLIGEEKSNLIKGFIYNIENRAQETIQQSLPDPQAALLKGILLGDESGLPRQLNDQFRATGLTHIIAISDKKRMIWKYELQG